MKYNESVGRYDLDLDDFGSKVLLHGPCCEVMLICHEVHSTQLVVTAWVYPVQVSLHMREVIQPATEQVGIQRSGKCSDFLRRMHIVVVYCVYLGIWSSLFTWSQPEPKATC